jgi:site-specific DNA-methyltransferase (adenine-specific)
MIKLHHGDCLEVLKTLPDNSVDSIVTDPPYGLSNHETEDVVECLTNWLAGKEYKPNKKGFMGKKWDGWVPSPGVWKECLRILKPGGHLLAFAGTRTMDLMYMSIRLAGFELRDSIGHANNASLVSWMHGQGFPKSLALGRAIDKEAGATREAAKQWEGFGTALKPAWEPIVLARKPITEKTVAKNVLKWGCGGINIDGTRISVDDNDPNKRRATGNNGDADSMFGVGNSKRPATLTQGRFPSNVVFSHTVFCTDGSCHETCAVKMLDEQSGILKNCGQNYKGGNRKSMFGNVEVINPTSYAGDTGTASRFFYCAKVSPSERGDSTHPTMKSIRLMGYLCRLVTPPNGVVCDPFMGSGSTGVACVSTGRKFIGIELDEKYFEIARERIARQHDCLASKQETLW